MIWYKLVSHINDMAFYEYGLVDSQMGQQGIIRINLAERTGALVELANGDALHWRRYEQVIRDVMEHYENGMIINSGMVD